MHKIFCIMGKSSSGKDTLYKNLLNDESLALSKIVLYTTRPIRDKEVDGREYHFTTQEQYDQYEASGKVIEARAYDTFYGIWRYYTLDDGQIDLQTTSYLIIGTPESFTALVKYFGEDKVAPIYVTLDDGERLQRALKRERKQKEPKYEEMCRRFLSDQEDFKEEKLAAAGIHRSFINEDLEACIAEVTAFIWENLDE